MLLVILSGLTAFLPCWECSRVCVSPCFFTAFFCVPSAYNVLGWCCAFRFHIHTFIRSFSCWFGALLVMLTLVRVFHARKQSPCWTIGSFLCPLFASPRRMIVHYAHPNHSCCPMYLQNVCVWFCFVCCTGSGRDHECVGSVQVCLPAFLVCICVC